MTRPSIARIVEAQRAIWSRLLLDVAPGECCWACGAIGHVDRAHIVAARNGGSVDPSNFFLLCGVCHAEQPDDSPRDEQLVWLRTHEADVTRVWRQAQARIGASA